MSSLSVSIDHSDYLARTNVRITKKLDSTLSSKLRAHFEKTLNKNIKMIADFTNFLKEEAHNKQALAYHLNATQ